jgi:hypothetical protein
MADVLFVVVTVVCFAVLVLAVRGGQRLGVIVKARL